MAEDGRPLFSIGAAARMVVDTGDGAFEGLVARVRDTGVKVLPLDLLERPLSLLCGSAA